MNILAIIPTRAKSQGLPGKSVKPLNGKPLVQHTIDQARRVGLFKTIVVVSDGDTEMELARKSGVFGIRKPEIIAGGDVPIEAVIEFVLKVLEKNGYTGYDAFCLLNPTSPLRGDSDIKEAVARFEKGSAISVVSVVKRWPIIMRRVRNAKRGYWHCPGLSSQNRQARKPSYVQNGAIYITRVDFFKDAKRLIGNRCYMHVMPDERSVDIDTIWDFLAAEAYLQELDKASGTAAEFIAGLSEAAEPRA